MLMMLAGFWFSGKDAPADAHDAGRTWGSLAKDAPADAHDAGRLGVAWQRTPQLMLMMLAGLGCSGKGRPG